MFKIIGVLLGIYVARCLATGSVYPKAGPIGRTHFRQGDSFRYWGAVGSYSVLALALIFIC